MHWGIFNPSQTTVSLKSVIFQILIIYQPKTNNIGFSAKNECVIKNECTHHIHLSGFEIKYQRSYEYTEEGGVREFVPLIFQD